MELKEGMYVRTYKGIIDKLDDKNIKMYQVSMFGLGDKPTKASHNIIDLIEVGDYVNGLRVYGITDFGLEVYMFGDAHEILEENEIKSIVTKEQFESMSYKVKE